MLSDYGMQPLSGTEYGGMLADVVRVPVRRRRCSRRSRPALDPVALGSVSDNVLDGYRAVAPHLAGAPGADVLIVCHGLKSVPLYAAQTALALGAGRVDYASDDAEALALAERLGARPIRTDFEKPERRYPIVVDAGLTPTGLRYADPRHRARRDVAERQLLRRRRHADAARPTLHARHPLLRRTRARGGAAPRGDAAHRGRDGSAPGRSPRASSSGRTRRRRTREPAIKLVVRRS